MQHGDCETCSPCKMVVLDCVVAVSTTITDYLKHVRGMNKLPEGTPEEQNRALKSSIMQQ